MNCTYLSWLSTLLIIQIKTIFSTHKLSDFLSSLNLDAYRREGHLEWGRTGNSSITLSDPRNHINTQPDVLSKGADRWTPPPATSNDLNTYGMRHVDGNDWVNAQTECRCNYNEWRMDEISPLGWRNPSLF